MMMKTGTTPRAAEGWGVFESEDDGCCHVAPIMGRPHVMSMGCWCLPRLDSQSTRIVVHFEEDA